MPTDSSRSRTVAETRARILDVAIETLGVDPDAGMADIATAAGVVRRTVYGHFPTRGDLVRTLTKQAVDEIAVVFDDARASSAEPDRVWAGFVERLWPVANRYRVLLALRRGEFGAEIHALLGLVDEMLAELVRAGQDSGAFATHLPSGLLSQVAYGAVFAVADTALADGSLGAREATVASLIVLGVPEPRARALANRV